MEDGIVEPYYKSFLGRYHKQPPSRKPSLARYSDYPVKTSTPRQQTMDGHSRMAEIDGLDSSKVKHFPFSSFKLLGALQIGLGVVCVLLGVVDLFLFLYASTHYDDDTLKALTIASIPVWCGLWFIVAGAMGSCMSLQQKTTLSYFKMTFLVLSVLCSVLFGPALVTVEAVICVMRTEDSEAAFEWLIPLIIAFVAFNEIILALITACICCCCSPLNQAKVRVLYTRKLDELVEPRSEPEKHRLDTPEIFYTDSSRAEKANLTQHYVYNRRDTYPTEYDHWDEKQSNRRPEPVQRLAIEPPPEESPRKPRVVTSDSPVMTHYSRPPTYEGNAAHSYRRMNKFALPGNPDEN
ncbi:hypothetical protein ACF0H5_011971 [Mactra antiquata]